MLLDEVWIWDNWEILFYVFGRKGIELKVKFFFCNFINLFCLCCFMENLVYFGINEVLGVRSNK